MNIGPPGSANALIEGSATTSKVKGNPLACASCEAASRLPICVHVILQGRIVDDRHLLAHLRGRLLPKLNVLLLGKQIETGLELARS